MKKVVDEAFAVGVGSECLSISQKNGVNGTQSLGRLIGSRYESISVFLVRNRHVATGITGGEQTAQKVLQGRWFDGLTGVNAVDAMLLQPVAVNERRTRVVDGPANDARLNHESISPAKRK